MKLFMIITFSLCVLYIQVIHGIVINDINVPHFITIDQDDSNDNIKLDCDYELSNNPSYLVVKWFLNNKGIYHWIRGQQPAVYPHYEDYIEVTPIAEDPNHEFRGFALVNPTIEFSGIYKCLVQTESDSKSIEKNLTIVDISNYTVSFKEHKVQNETHLECTVQNIYPKPILTLESDNDMITIQKSDPIININENAYFDTTQRAVAHTSDSADQFACYISFKGLPLNISANVLTSSSQGIHWSSSSSSLLLFICCTFLMSKLL